MITLFIINLMFKALCWLTYAGIMVAAVIIDFCVNFVFGFITSFINSFITEYRKAKQAAIEEKEHALLEYYDN